VTELPPEIEPIVLAVLEKRVGAAKAASRVPLEPLYAEGQSRKIRSPLDDAVLGVVGRESPDPRWEIVNRDALAKHLEQDPANVEYVDEIASEAAAIEVLREHAPELLVRIERVRADAFTAALRAARTGEAPAPGIARIKPDGRLYVRPDKHAGEAIERLVAAKVITFDGRPLQLPAGTSEQLSQPVSNDQKDEASA
jgi:hypothetical protein